MAEQYDESLHWEEVILYLYNEYDTYEDAEFQNFRQDVIEYTTISDEDRADEILDFLKSVELIEYGDKVEHHPLTTRGFETARDLESSRNQKRKERFNKSTQVVISTMTFFLGLSAVAQIATIYDLSEDVISGILVGTILALIIGVLLVNYNLS